MAELVIPVAGGRAIPQGRAQANPADHFGGRLPQVVNRAMPDADTYGAAEGEGLIRAGQMVRQAANEFDQIDERNKKLNEYEEAKYKEVSRAKIKTKAEQLKQELINEAQQDPSKDAIWIEQQFSDQIKADIDSLNDYEWKTYQGNTVKQENEILFNGLLTGFKTKELQKFQLDRIATGNQEVLAELIKQNQVNPSMEQSHRLAAELYDTITSDPVNAIVYSGKQEQTARAGMVEIYKDELAISIHKNPGQVIENLTAQDKEGGYKYYKELDPQDRMKLLDQAEKEHKKLIEEWKKQNVVENLLELNDETGLPLTKEEGKELDENIHIINKQLEGLPFDQRLNVMATVMVQRQYVPEAWKQELNQATSSIDLNNRKKGYEVIGTITARQPRLREYFSEEQLIGADMIRGGHTVEQAARGADQLQSLPEDIKDYRKDKFREEYADDGENKLRSEFERIFGDKFDTWFSSEAEIPEALYARYNSMRRNLFLATGDVDVANRAAAEALSSRVRPSTMNGTRTMEFAPFESFYPEEAVDLLKQRAKEEIETEYGLKPGEYRLVGDFVTIEDEKKSNVPSYAILQQDGSFLIGENGLKVRYQPDVEFIREEAKKRIAERSRNNEQIEKEREGFWERKQKREKELEDMKFELRAL